MSCLRTRARYLMHIALLVALFVAATAASRSQTSPDLEKFFRQSIGLTKDQIAAIQNGQAVTKEMPARIPAEVFLFGAVYIHATPDAYLRYARDFDRLRKVPGYLALDMFGNPPQLSDLEDFSFDRNDIQALKRCKPGDCLIQAPANSIEQFQLSTDWSASDVSGQVNQLLRQIALQFLLDYGRNGNQALGFYNDKPNPTAVAQQFAYMLSYTNVLPEHLPDFYQYLLGYPNARPANVEDSFYWEKVKFGLKPTLRIVHVVTMRGKPTDEVACAIAEKQLYSSHYFETALDLTFCIPGATGDTNQSGFYLVKVLGSEQAGLGGVKGSIVRKEAVGRSVSSLRELLTIIRDSLTGSEATRNGAEGK